MTGAVRPPSPDRRPPESLRRELWALLTLYAALTVLPLLALWLLS